MKRTLLFAALSSALLLSNTSEAQVPVVNKILPKVTVGLKVGANFQQITGSETWDNAMKAGYHGGAFVGLTKNKWGVQGEVLVRSTTYSFSDALKAAGGDNDITTTCLDVPILLQYKLITRLWLQVGPQFSDMLSAKAGGQDVKNNFNSADISGVAGLQLILPIHLVAGARYVLGFSDVDNKNNSGATEAWKNRSIQVYVGFRLL